MSTTRTHTHKAETLLAKATEIHNVAEKTSDENGGLPADLHHALMSEAGLLTAMAQVHATLAVANR